jgi:hypothetical protein
MFKELVQPHAQPHAQQDLPVEVGLLILGNIYLDIFINAQSLPMVIKRQNKKKSSRAGIRKSYMKYGPANRWCPSCLLEF